MTQGEILTMPAGREMDALVAEKVMGWKWEGCGFLTPPEDHPASIGNWAAEWDKEGRPHWLPDYSTDISAAWELHRKIITESLFSTRQIYFRELQNAVSHGKGFTIAWPDVLVYLEPEHICKAALLAFLEEK